MKRFAVAILALALTGCAVPQDVMVEPVIAESAAPARETAPRAKIEACVPGEDDGIGGTGCAID